MLGSTDSHRDKSVGKRLLTSFVVAEFFLLTGNLVVRICDEETSLPTWTLALIAIASVIPMLLFAASFFRIMRSDLDEMLQRIVLEGLAFALVVFVPIAGIYVNARAAGILTSNLDPPELLLLPTILVVFGIFISWRRHK